MNWNDLDRLEQSALQQCAFPVTEEFVGVVWRSLERRGLVRIIRIDHRRAQVDLTEAGKAILPPALDFNKLSKVKKQIIRSVYRFGACLDMTYAREKEALQRAGWLQGRRIGDSIISGQWMLTDAGREAYEDTQRGV